MSGGVIEFKVGDLLIEETPPPPWSVPPGWKPEMGICMEHVPDRDRAHHINILVEVRVIYGWPPGRWKLASRAEGSDDRGRSWCP
jgi:hypothetical protein